MGGYRSISDFVVSTVYERAQMILQQSETILASQRDSEIFFNALVNSLSVCFVCDESETGKIQGYYTVSNNSIPIGVVPEGYKIQFPNSCHSIPTTLLGRLAVDIRYQGLGAGRMLLIDALQRSYMISGSVGSFAVVVGPLDEEAERFYKKYGFILLLVSQKMFLPMRTLEMLFDRK